MGKGNSNRDRGQGRGGPRADLSNLGGLVAGGGAPDQQASDGGTDPGSAKTGAPRGTFNRVQPRVDSGVRTGNQEQTEDARRQRERIERDTLEQDLRDLRFKLKNLCVTWERLSREIKGFVTTGDPDDKSLDQDLKNQIDTLSEKVAPLRAAIRESEETGTRNSRRAKEELEHSTIDFRYDIGDFVDWLNNNIEIPADDPRLYNIHRQLNILKIFSDREEYVVSVPEAEPQRLRSFATGNSRLTDQTQPIKTAGQGLGKPLPENILKAPEPKPFLMRLVEDQKGLLTQAVLDYSQGKMSGDDVAALRDNTYRLITVQYGEELRKESAPKLRQNLDDFYHCNDLLTQLIEADICSRESKDILDSLAAGKTDSVELLHEKVSELGGFIHTINSILRALQQVDQSLLRQSIGSITSVLQARKKEVETALKKGPQVTPASPEAHLSEQELLAFHSTTLEQIATEATAGTFSGEITEDELVSRGVIRDSAQRIISSLKNLGVIQ